MATPVGPRVGPLGLGLRAISSAHEDEDDDRPLFQVKTLTKSRPAAKPKGKATASGLSGQSRDQLNGVLRELLELKRLLDRARDS